MSGQSKPPSPRKSCKWRDDLNASRDLTRDVGPVIGIVVGWCDENGENEEDEEEGDGIGHAPIPIPLFLCVFAALREPNPDPVERASRKGAKAQGIDGLRGIGRDHRNGADGGASSGVGLRRS